MHRKPRKRGPDVWVWRQRIVDTMGVERNTSSIVGTVDKLSTEQHAWAASEQQRRHVLGTTLQNLIERYRSESLDVRRSTEASYSSRFNRHIIPLWGDLVISEIKPLDVERKINGLNLSKKSKSHIKAQMHRLFEFAMKCELIEFQRNPILSVEIRGIRRRVRGKQVLTSQQIHILPGAADLRLQVMIVLSCCLGLRPSEVLGLQWQDIDFARGSLAVSRSITGQHVADTKTEDSEAEVFLDSKITALLLRWKDQCCELQQPWLFANVDTGRPFHADSLRQNYLRPLGRAIGIPNLGWYAFRHTYRTLVAGKLLPESMKAASRTTIH